MNANQCLILDDEELEQMEQMKQEDSVMNRDLRAWLPQNIQHANPFTSQYISTSHSFPKVFHMKNPKEDYPKLSEREVPVMKTTMNYRSRLLQKTPAAPAAAAAQELSTINVLERVREVLHDVSGVQVSKKDISGVSLNTSLVKCRSCGGPHWTLCCEKNKVAEEDAYVSHTPPYYPPASPPFITNTPPINQIIYPIGIFLSSPIPSTPSSTPQEGFRKENLYE